MGHESGTIPEFDRLFRDVLPARLPAAAGQAAARDVAGVGAIAFRLPDGRAYRLAPRPGTIAIAPGDDAPAVIRLDAAAWDDFVTERATAAGLYYAGRLDATFADYVALERWEPALRALLDGRPIFDPAAAAALDVDPREHFSWDTPDAALRAFLHATGYLHVRAVFSRDEIARLADLVEARRAAAQPGDGRSWWATREDGTRLLCRLTYLGLVEPAIAALGDDPRLRRLMALAGPPLRAAVDRSDGHSVVLKHGRVVQGLADLPWHRDCGLGGHPVMCPALNIGIQLDAATAETGQLHVVPGSWRASCHRADLDRAPTVALATEAGDVTVHFGDLMHAAPPPAGDGPGRRTLYVTCMPEGAFAAIPPGRSYNDVILARVGA